MIIKIIKVVSSFLYPTKVRTKSRVNCLAFSTLKQRAEKYLCAAVAYRTLADADPDKIYCFKSALSHIQDSNNNSKFEYEPFSLRERVIHNINKLILDSEQNREEIRNIFQLKRGLKIQNKKITNRIRSGGEKQNKQLNFVFNPTLLFKEIHEKLIILHITGDRQMFFGEFGIGKTANQLLIAHLTQILFLFRKEGKEAEAQLEALLKRNQQVLKEILHLTSCEAKKIQKKQTEFLKIVKQNLNNIPFVYFYSLPEDIKKCESDSKLGLQKQDFLKYFTEEQIRNFGIKQMPNDLDETKIDLLNLTSTQKSPKLNFSLQSLIQFHNKNNTKDFLIGLTETCEKYRIKFILITDQINLFFKSVGQQSQLKSQISWLQFQKNSLEKNKKIEKDNFEYKNKIDVLKVKSFKCFSQIHIYEQILQQINSALYTNDIVYIASAKLQYAPIKSIGYIPLLAHPYATRLFNKTISIRGSDIKYPQNIAPEIWQKQMDVVFLFQMERTLMKLLSKKKAIFSSYSNYSQQKISDITKQLRYLFHKQMTKQQLQEEKWNGQTRHLFIRQSFTSTQFQVIKPLQQILEQIFCETFCQLNREGQRVTSQQRSKGKENLVQMLKDLKKIVNQTTLNLYKRYNLNQNQKLQTVSETILKQLFFLRLFNKVEQMPQNQNEQQYIIITSDMFDQIIEKQKQSKIAVQYLKLLINKDFQQVIHQNGMVVLKNKCSFEGLRRYLREWILQIDFELFLHQMIQINDRILGEVAKIIIKQTLTTIQTKVYRIGNGQSQYLNIINQESAYFPSIVGADKSYKQQKKRYIRAFNLQAYAQKNNLSFLDYKANHIKIIKKINQGIKQPEDKFQLQSLGQDQIQFLRFCAYNSFEKCSQQVIRKWNKYTNKNSYSLQDTFKHVINRFQQNLNKMGKQFQPGFPTYVAKPYNQIKKMQQIESPNNPYFDLVLVKKLQENNPKKYKFIFIDVTLDQRYSYFQYKIKNLIDFKDFFLLDNLQFLNKNQIEFWHLCPQNKAKKYRKELYDFFISEQKARDELNEVPSESIKYRVVDLEELIIFSKQEKVFKRYFQILEFVIKEY